MSVTKMGKEFDPNAAYKWYFADSGVDSPNPELGWDMDGGVGWHLIDFDEYEGYVEKDESGRSISISADFVPNFEVFKCVAAFGGETLEDSEGNKQSFGVVKVEAMETIVDQTDALNVVIESSEGDVFREDTKKETTVLTCTVILGAEKIDASKFLYSWIHIEEDGTQTVLANKQASEKLTINVKSDIIDTETYICEVFVKK